MSSTLFAADAKILGHLAGKRFLITGASGMLGRAFELEISRLVPTANVTAANRVMLDVTDQAAFERFFTLRPDYVLHCAAMVDADRCESEVEEARRSIVDGTINAISFARKCGAAFLYPQSFLIYDESKSPIDEATEPRPLSVYGQLKLAAERAVLESDVPSTVIRMGGFFGGEKADDNFVGRMAPHLSNLVRQGVQSIEIGNRVWQPTFTHDLAANSLLLLADDRRGIYCMASHGSASFHELAVEITRLMNIDARVRVDMIDASLLAAREKARRPHYAVMQNSRLQRENLDRQRPWNEALSEYLRQPYFREMCT